MPRVSLTGSPTTPDLPNANRSPDLHSATHTPPVCDSHSPRLRYSIFENVFNTTPKATESTWPALCRSLGIDRSPSSQLGETDQKLYLPAICGASFLPGSTRAGGNTQSLQLCLFDIDNTEAVPDSTGVVRPSGHPKLVKQPVKEMATFEEVNRELARLGIAAYSWTTWSHSREWPHFRVLLPLAVPVNHETWDGLVSWVLDVSGLRRWLHCFDVGCSTDTARLFFLPAQRPDGPAVERAVIDGEILAPPGAEDLMRLRAPQPELRPWQLEHLARQTARSTATKAGRYDWARRFKGSDGSLLDLRTLDGIQLLESLGCRVGPGRPWGSGVKHRTSCPWWCEHSHDADDDSGALFLNPGRWPEWHCSHAHHAHLRLVDLLEMAGVLHGAA